jgi:type II secretory pathway pseudopilin PulG
MMNKKNTAGFMLLEAILTVVIVSICLTFMAQALLTNFRTGVRFQETVRSLVVMENTLGSLYATNARGLQAQIDVINDHLKKVDLRSNWPGSQAGRPLDVTTIIYYSNET